MEEKEQTAKRTGADASSEDASQSTKTLLVPMPAAASPITQASTTASIPHVLAGHIQMKFDAHKMSGFSLSYGCAFTMVGLLQNAQALPQHPLQYPLQPQIQAQLQKTLQPPSYEHLFQRLARVFPVHQQLPNVHHMSLRQSSPQLLPELATPYPYQFPDLPLFQPRSYPAKLEKDFSGYPVMAGPNPVVYPSHQIKMLPIKNPHSIKAYGNYPRANFIPSKQSQILNSHAQQETATKLLNSLAEEKQHVCRHEGCTWAFFRLSDLKRHAKSHTKPMFHCPYWNVYRSCHRNGGSFSRLDMLKRHLRLVHYVRNKQLSNGDRGWCRACQKLFNSSKSFVDHCLECAASLAKGENDFDVKENEIRA